MTCLIAGLIVILCFSQPVVAHQQKDALTEILLNPRSGNLEIAHRFYIHDAEHAAKQISGEKQDFFNSETLQAAFYQYVVDEFNLMVDGKPLELTTLGFELEGAFFWAYQEAPFNRPLESIDIRQGALLEFWPTQTNIVNVQNSDKEILTAIFRNPLQTRRLIFKSSPATSP